jgi:hypothetical protein
MGFLRTDNFLLSALIKAERRQRGADEEAFAGRPPAGPLRSVGISLK